MRGIVVFLMTFLCLSTSCGVSEDVIDPTEVGKWEEITVADGLPSNSTTTIHQASNGDIWIGTLDGGISRFDGKKYTNFTTDDWMSSNVIFDITEWSGGILAGTFDGVSFYDGSDWYVLTGSDVGLFPFAVTSVLGDSYGNLWMGTNQMLYILEDGYFYDLYDYSCNNCNYIFDVFQDSNEDIWVGTLGGLKRYRPGSEALFTIADGLKSNYVTRVIQDSKGLLWIGYGDSSFITSYDGSIFSSYYLGNDGLQQGYTGINGMAQDLDGLLWIGTGGDGLGNGSYGVIRTDLKIFEAMHTENSQIPNDFIADILVADNGDVWVTTFGDGIVKYIWK